MLVHVTGDESAIDAAEQRVITQLRELRHPGVVAVDVTVDDRHLDAVVWTPGACVVVDIVGLGTPMSGELEVPASGDWSVGGVRAALERVEAGTPLTHVKGNYFAVKGRLKDAFGESVRVRGIVVLAPPPGSDVWPDRIQIDGTRDVVVDTGLDAFFGSMTGAPRWSADGVRKAAEQLGLGAVLPTADALMAEGFPATLVKRRGVSLAKPPARQPVAAPPASTELDPDDFQWVHPVAAPAKPRFVLLTREQRRWFTPMRTIVGIYSVLFGIYVLTVGCTLLSRL